MQSPLQGKVVTVEYWIQVRNSENGKQRKIGYCTGILEGVDVDVGALYLDWKIIPWSRIIDVELATSSISMKDTEMVRYGTEIKQQAAEFKTGK
jgi:hypothetical protein